MASPRNYGLLSYPFLLQFTQLQPLSSIRESRVNLLTDTNATAESTKETKEKITGIQNDI